MGGLFVRRALLSLMVVTLAGCAGSTPDESTVDAAGSTDAAQPGTGGTTGSTGGNGLGGSGTGGSAGTTSTGGQAGTSTGAGGVKGTGGTGGQGVAGAAGAAGVKGAGGAGGLGAAGTTGLAGTGAGGKGGSAGTGGAAGAKATGGASGVAGSPGSGGSSGAAGSTDPCGPGNPATVPLPMIGSGTFNITSYGAVGDDKTDDTKAIQAALTAAASAGGGTVEVPSGTFLAGPIVVSSGTRLELAAGSTLKMLAYGTYPNSTAFITCPANSHDIALTGWGTIDGQGQAWWNALTATPSLARPQEVSLQHVTRVQVSGIRLINPPEEHIWVKNDTDVTVTGITISTLAVSGQHGPNNTDGVDINATGAFFCNNNVACGDDNVVMDGKNIYVGYSTFGVGHGCTIGSGTTGGITNVTVDHLTMNGTTAGIRLKSYRGNGGDVTGLTYSNITMTNVPTPVSIESYYPTLPSDPTTDPAQAVTAGTPIWENITIKNVTATGSSNAGILWGLPEAKISNVVFDDVKIKATTGMKIFHATGISFIDGSSVTVSSGAAVTTYDATVTGIQTTAY
jgi:polygalacturonase